MMKICEIEGGMEKIIRSHLLKKKKNHHRRFNMNEWKYSLIEQLFNLHNSLTAIF